MSETRVEIADTPGSEPERSEDSPYRNLWVPLVLVPAGIVMVIVLIFVLFGSAVGKEASVSENLEKVVHGGANERDQALFTLARQVSENQRARNDGEELPWALEQGFGERLRAAALELDAEDHETRLTLAVLMDILGDPKGVETLMAMLDLDASADPAGQMRFDAILNLGISGNPLAGPSILPFLDHEDEGLRTAAAGALSKLEVEGVREGLIRALNDASLAVRGSAALSLSKLDPPEPAAATLLRDLAETAVYSAENERDAKKYRVAKYVSGNRVRAVQALARLAREEDRTFLQGLSEDSDLDVASAALRALADWDKP